MSSHNTPLDFAKEQFKPIVQRRPGRVETREGSRPPARYPGEVFPFNDRSGATKVGCILESDWFHMLLGVGRFTAKPLRQGIPTTAGDAPMKADSAGVLKSSTRSIWKAGDVSPFGCAKSAPTPMSTFSLRWAAIWCRYD
jgi:hypothetical protein